MSRRIIVETSASSEIVDVTDQLAALVAEAGSGIAFFNTPHTTAALILSEDDAELREDLLRVTGKLLADLRPFRHARNNNPNAEAHIFSALFGVSVVVPIEDGKLDLGTWQRILFIELDGPKQREIRCRVIGA